jgi:hypothetical protein
MVLQGEHRGLGVLLVRAGQGTVLAVCRTVFALFQFSTT